MVAAQGQITELTSKYDLLQEALAKSMAAIEASQAKMEEEVKQRKDIERERDKLEEKRIQADMQAASEKRRANALGDVEASNRELQRTLQSERMQKEALLERVSELHSQLQLTIDTHRMDMEKREGETTVQLTLLRERNEQLERSLHVSKLALKTSDEAQQVCGM